MNNVENIKVSCVTVTQLSRWRTLKLLREMIEYQTYVDYVIEWVIVEGSQSKEDADKNEKNIQNLINSTELPIKYIPYVEGSKLGALRNRSNSNCRGNYIVCFDDDDYYYPTRIEHAVVELEKSDKLIAGCTNCHIFDYLINRQLTAGNFGENWSTNGCMAYKKEYLINHKYDDDCVMGEERSFLNNQTEPMIQLDSNKVTILSSHGFNTYNKRSMLVLASLGAHPLIKPMNQTLPIEYSTRYKKIFTTSQKSTYDIVYVCGFLGIEWDPCDKKLGGSEQAVVHLSEEWSKNGYKVAVYGKIPKKNINNVSYFPMEHFPYDNLFNTLIIWRESGLFSILPFDITANKIYLDLHDTIDISQNKNAHKQLLQKISKIFFKSEYHKKKYEASLEINFGDRAIVIPNGVRVDDFKKDDGIIREQYRFTYASCYTRGIIQILAHVWSKIYKEFPDAELFIYYGMEHIKDKNIINMLKSLFSQPGICEKGRRDVETIKKEKYKSSFQLYVTNTELEIDCISIKESLVTGCIPLISNYGVFAERDGVHFELNEGTPDDYERIALEIIDLIKNNEKVEKIRNELYKSNTIIEWKDIAKQWIIAGNLTCEQL